jgi:hypothetical protein
MQNEANSKHSCGFSGPIASFRICARSPPGPAPDGGAHAVVAVEAFDLSRSYSSAPRRGPLHFAHMTARARGR